MYAKRSAAKGSLLLCAVISSSTQWFSGIIVARLAVWTFRLLSTGAHDFGGRRCRSIAIDGI